MSGSNWAHSHGATRLAPAPFAANLATFYADVSLGDVSGFDPAGNGLFSEDAFRYGYFEAPAGLGLASHLPAGVNDAHQYGDENCDFVTDLDGALDSFAAGSITAIVSGWSCARQEWAADAGEDFNCEDAEDELNCFLLYKVGDGYDLRDVECQDNDVLGESTTDDQGVLADSGFDGRSCQHLQPAPK